MSYQSIDPKSIQRLPELNKQLEKCSSDHVETKLKFVRPFFVAYLDQTFRTYRREKEITLMPWHKNTHKYLEQCGFEYLLGNCSSAKEYDQSLIIPLIRFGKSDNVIEDVMNWLDGKVFNFIPEMNTKLQQKVRENLWEIVENGLKHGMGEFGISACGQFYPQMNYFEMAFYDAGVGMARKIKEFGAVKETEPDYNCIKWALQKGSSTSDEPASGMGLFYLRKFINLNRGTIQFISGNGLLDCSSDTDIDYLLNNSFSGTLVNIRINYNQGEGIIV